MKEEELEFDVLLPFLCGEARLSPKDVVSSATSPGTGYGLIPGGNLGGICMLRSRGSEAPSQRMGEMFI